MTRGFKRKPLTRKYHGRVGGDLRKLIYAADPRAIVRLPECFTDAVSESFGGERAGGHVLFNDFPKDDSFQKAHGDLHQRVAGGPWRRARSKAGGGAPAQFEGRGVPE